MVCGLPRRTDVNVDRPHLVSLLFTTFITCPLNLVGCFLSDQADPKMAFYYNVNYKEWTKEDWDVLD